MLFVSLLRYCFLFFVHQKNIGDEMFVDVSQSGCLYAIDIFELQHTFPELGNPLEV